MLRFRFPQQSFPSFPRRQRRNSTTRSKRKRKPNAIAKAKIAVCEIPGWLDASVDWFVGLAIPVGSEEDAPVALTVTVSPLTSLKSDDTVEVLEIDDVEEEAGAVLGEDEEVVEVLEVVDVDVVVGFVA